MKSNDIWQLLDENFKKDPDLMGGEVFDLTEINIAEQKIGLKFSTDYIKFIQKYGGALVGSYLVYGLRKQEYMGNSLWSVIDNTFFFRNQEWPDIENWYIVSDDGCGNPIGVDPDGKVWLSDHDAGFEQVQLADSFEEFLYKLHTDTLYE